MRANGSAKGSLGGLDEVLAGLRDGDEWESQLVITGPQVEELTTALASARP